MRVFKRGCFCVSFLRDRVLSERVLSVSVFKRESFLCFF